MLYGLTTGGRIHSWKSAAVLALLIIGFVGHGVFILVESKAAMVRTVFHSHLLKTER